MMLHKLSHDVTRTNNGFDGKYLRSVAQNIKVCITGKI
jgi:hypothetical protein